MRSVTRFVRMLGVVVATTALLTACGNTSFGGGKPDAKSGSKSGAKADKDPATDDDGEAEKADQPALVTGSFLTCSFLSEPDAAAATAPIGCAGYVDGTKLEASACTFELALTDAGVKVDMHTAAPDAGSPWHIHADLPSTYVKKDGKLTMRATCNAKTHRMSISTLDIKTSGALGLTSPIATGAKWVPNQNFLTDLGLPNQGMYAQDFCNSDGTLVDKWSSPNADKARDYGQDPSNRVKAEKIPADSCFKELGIAVTDSVILNAIVNQAFKKDYVQSIAGGKCMLVWASDAVYVIQTGKPPEMTTDFVKTYVDQHRCP